MEHSVNQEKNSTLIDLFNHLPVCLSIHPPTHPPIHPSILTKFPWAAGAGLFHPGAEGPGVAFGLPHKPPSEFPPCHMGLDGWGLGSINKHSH